MKNILVTGVSRGLGLSITKKLLSNNEYRVIGVSRGTSASLNDLTENEADRFIHIPFDLAKYNDISELVFKHPTITELGIHGFVNNAAIAYDDLISNINSARLEEMFNVNVFSPMIMVKLVLRNMLLHNIKGSIVHVSSISVHTGYKGLAMYAATKGAIEAFSKNTAREWGERGIRSNVIIAGFMDTDMSGSLSSIQKQRIYNRTCLKLPTNTDSVAESVEFLLSEKSISITGSFIQVDSGTI